MGHRPFSELTKDWPEERKARVSLEAQKLIEEIREENGIFGAIYETAAGMCDAGVITKDQLWEFAELMNKVQDKYEEDQPKFVLEEMLKQIPKDYQSEEVDWGKPVGQEVG